MNVLVVRLESFSIITNFNMLLFFCAAVKVEKVAAKEMQPGKTKKISVKKLGPVQVVKKTPASPLQKRKLFDSPTPTVGKAPPTKHPKKEQQKLAEEQLEQQKVSEELEKVIQEEQ